MAATLLRHAATTLDRLYLPVCVLFCAALAYNHFQLITFEFPLDRNEAGMLSITATLTSGGNPFAQENQPSNASVYPILHNLIVAPLSLVAGNTFLLHRSIVGLFIIAACVLIYRVTLRASNSRRNSFAAASLVYAGLLYYSTPVAGPNGVGLFLFLLAIFIPWFDNFSTRSLAVALVLGVLSFYGKQYFVASLGFIALYVFLAVSKLRGLLFGIAALLAMLASLAFVIRIAPFYLDNTYYSVKFPAKFIASNEKMIEQMLMYLKIMLPVLGIAVLNLFLSRGEASAAREVAGNGATPRRFLDFRNPAAPLLGWKPDYLWLCFWCSTLIIVVNLGKNPGNHGTYLFQLMSPFLLASAFIGLSRVGRFKWIYQLLVFAAIFNSYNMLSHDYSVPRENWERMRKVVASGETIYASSIILGEIVRNGGEVFQNGHTPYIRFAVWKPGYMERDAPEETASAIWERHVARIHAMIEAREFDLVILDERTKIPNPQSFEHAHMDGMVLLDEYYRVREVIPIWLAKRRGGGRHQMFVWEPIPDDELPLKRASQGYEEIGSNEP